ncbi:hypothetical protein BRARA_C00840 [Brassica rapa]|uniref:Replication factor A C-terminal domain-containing protein n=1 Tax=Brassica campestris TaxID=3711 RepID=A0A397ZSX5_BRACM|nr:hypothetical protein BRARA_C00840 [Brassica rapa]
MANPQVLLADLNAGRCSNVAEVRLLRYWEARNVRKDIIGELSAIRSTITDRIAGAQRVMLTLRLESGENVCVSMFDSLALAFHTKFDSYGREPKVIIATGVNPKIVGGHGAVPGESTSKVVHAQKIEPMTLSELNQFIITAESQIIEFLCTAKVTGIQQDEGWCYIGCSGCSKKLVREISSFTCLSCNETNAVAALRYRVALSVSDNTDTASFLAFDTEMAKLTNLQASEAAQIVGIGVDAQVDTELPQSLADIVGKTYTFQLKLNDFNFSSKHQTFTISRIFPERPTTSDASTGKRPPPAKDQDDDDKTAPKKAHVE